MNPMTIEQVAEYFINSIATRPVYPEDPTQRWYRICNEVYNFTQAGWGTNELCDKFYTMANEFPNITGHAYYISDLIGHAQPNIVGQYDQNVRDYHQQVQNQENAMVETLLPDAPTYVEVPWEETTQPLFGQDPFAGFSPEPTEQATPVVEYGAPAVPVQYELEVGQPAIPTPPLMEEPKIELPTDLEAMPDIQMPEGNPWGNLATLSLMQEFHQHKERLGLDNETVIPHIRHYLEKEDATFEDITPDNIGRFNEYLMTIQA